MAATTLVLASNNRGKVTEFQQLFAPHHLCVVPQGELNIPETDEPFHTFVENALHKARHASQCSGLPALADDSGLCVPALQGAPGVLSARYAGEPKSDARNNTHLLNQMAHITQRQAYFYCVLVLIRHAEDPQPIIADGIWMGEILSTAQGLQGFGYDPLFWDPHLNSSAAMLEPHQKHTVSHRGQAVRTLLEKLPQGWPYV